MTRIKYVCKININRNYEQSTYNTYMYMYEYYKQSADDRYGKISIKKLLRFTFIFK